MKMLKEEYKKFRNSKYIAKFSRAFGAKSLWSFDKSSVEKGIALGVACSWIPLPFHTTIAVFLAVLIDCNILLVITSIWFANPITMPFMYYCAYILGTKIIPISTSHVEFKFSADTILRDLHIIWKPFLLGCTILGICCGLLTYFTLHFAWPNFNKKLKIRKN